MTDDLNEGYIRTPRPDTPAELQSKIEDCDARLAAAADRPPPERGSLLWHCLGITQSYRDRAAAELQTHETLDRIASAAGKGGKA